MENEIWVDLLIDGLSYTQVSNMGRVRSLEHSTTFYRSTEKRNITRPYPSKVYSQKNDKDGYKSVTLMNKKTYFVHRLVALMFLDNTGNKPVVNHKDGVKYNNLVSNLEWCTHSENDLHAYKIGLRTQKGKNHNNFGKYDIQDVHKAKGLSSGELNNKAKLTEEDVLEIRSLAGLKLQSEIGKMYSISQAMVSAIIRRANWSHV